MNKAIYNPKGKAGEYAEWACNLYVGCSNDCDYCYCKRGVLAHAMGGPVPKLKSCFQDEDYALEIFIKELENNLTELQNSSLFFTFSSDPMIPETRRLNWDCIVQAVIHDVPVQVLTKNADFIKDEYIGLDRIRLKARVTDMIAWGFTLTGHNEKEPGASTNEQRITTMSKLKEIGFKTFASIEPVIKPADSLQMFKMAEACCDLFKVGLMSGVGKDYYKKEEVEQMVKDMKESGRQVYLKKSLTSYLHLPEEDPIDIFKL